MASPEPLLVQAIYSFKGKNNDELNFKKGDVIVVTQKEDGGWWEGTFNEKTGWFPSNYCQEYKPSPDALSSPVKFSSPVKLPPEISINQKANRALVLKDIVESERTYVNELNTLIHNFLVPIDKSDIMSKDEFRQLTSNIKEILILHEQLLVALENCIEDQRMGRVFMQYAPEIKQVHYAYANSHPRAVCVLDTYKDELTKIMESSGASSPGLLVLTTGLSKPLRRLEKYSGLLQELERHVEESHVDRGDSQRCVSVYRDIAAACTIVRRQKELELEVLTGGVRGWEGEELSHLGDVLHMGSVALGSLHQDRYFVLFPTTLLMLSVSSRMSAFVYEGKLPLTGIVVKKLDDNEIYKNAFEISGPLIETIIAICQTKDDLNLWIDKLQTQIRQTRNPSGILLQNNTSLSRPIPPPHHPSLNPRPNSCTSSINEPQWNLTNLRPAPPMHPSICRNEKLKPYRCNEKSYDEDGQILKVIEAYCSTNSRSRHTLNSANLDSPTLDLFDKSLVSNDILEDVRKLKDDMSLVQSKLVDMMGTVDFEKKARIMLQDILSQHLTNLNLPEDMK